MNDILVVKNLSKTYISSRKKVVIRSVEMSVQKGKCVCIVGQNGAGKSTFLKIVAGIVPRSSGIITLNGDIGYVPEVSINFPNLNLKENIEFYNSIFNDGKVSMDYISFFKLPQTGKKIKKFSKGMKRKFDLIRALSTNPALCILDEPFEGLDPSTCRDMINLLLTQKQNGMGILMSSHDMSYVEKITDKVLLLKDGKFLELDDWKERKVTLFVEMEMKNVIKLLDGKQYRIKEENEVIKITIPLQDYADIYSRIVNNGGNVIRQENSSLEDLYLEKLEE